MTRDFLPYGTTDRTAGMTGSTLPIPPYGKQSPKPANGARKKTATRPSPLLAPEAGGSTAAPEQIALMNDGWNRKMSAAIAWLRHAEAMISLAESKIAAQQERISLLEDLATTDDLTGIRNRRGFYECFVREIENCNRGVSKGGLLVMIDLDNFKSVNDTFGHMAGDAVLKLVARTLSNEVRKTDYAARLGGDEFILLFTNTTKKDAAARAQIITCHLNNLSLAWYGDIIPVQASVGLKAFGAGARADAILQAADGTLYASKFDRKHNSGLEQPSSSFGGSIRKSP